MIQIDAFDIVAFIVLGVLLGAVVVVIVLLGGLPGKIAAVRNHPQARAINAAGWISLITLGALWPVAFVWAFMPPRSNGSASDGGAAS
jgi:NADH:ubiquinone oxidoreductase subunit 6 (subunit J)